MNWYAQPCGKRGRNAIYSDEAIKCCLMLNVLFKLPLRQVSGFVQSLLTLCNPTWSVPDYSTLCRRQRSIHLVSNTVNQSQSLHLLVDSTGIKMRGEGEWKRKKHDRLYRRQWRKLHIGVDATTLEICALKVSSNRTSDASVLPGLLNELPSNQSIQAVYGDGAYDAKGGRSAIAKRGALAIIPPRKNVQLWKENLAYAKKRNEQLRAQRHLGMAIWKKWTGYHLRSLVETKMSCNKRILSKLMSRRFDSQVAKLHACIAVLNKFQLLGRVHTQVAT